MKSLCGSPLWFKKVLQKYLTTVRRRADRASLWKVMITLVAGKSTRHCFRWHLKKKDKKVSNGSAPDMEILIKSWPQISALDLLGKEQEQKDWKKDQLPFSRPGFLNLGSFKICGFQLSWGILGADSTYSILKFPRLGNTALSCGSMCPSEPRRLLNI